MNVLKIYSRRNGAGSTKLIRELSCRGPQGRIASLLFQICKSNHRAQNNSGKLRRNEFEKKDELIADLVGELVASDLRWGWRGIRGEFAFLIIDLEQFGQVRIIASPRLGGPDWTEEIDETESSASVICRFAQFAIDKLPTVFDLPADEPTVEPVAEPTLDDLIAAFRESECSK